MPCSNTTTLSARNTTIGSPDAAQDLYGLGVRIGFYLQALGMLLYTYSGSQNHGQGLKIASGSIAISVLACWFRFAARGLFSAAEAVIVLLILTGFSFPAKTTLANSRCVLGDMSGLAAILVVELANCAALLWTFATLVNELPPLDTPNTVFFFAEVALRGWFRYLALVYCVFDAATSLSFAFKVVRVMRIAGRYYYDGGGNRDNDNVDGHRKELDEIDKIMDWKDSGSAMIYLPWLFWVLTVVAAELTIKWNHLSPSDDLTTPGQLMPLITGIITVIDSSLVAGRCHILPYIKILFPRAKAFFQHIFAFLGRVRRQLEPLATALKEWLMRLFRKVFC